jgi:gamma-glutamyl-gamma-aminobutyraldehyde dehydrogenase
MTAQTPIEAPDWHARARSLKPETRLFIDGRFVEAKKGDVFPTVNPATGQVIAQMSKGGVEDVDLAVKAARRAFRSGVWSKMAPRDRMNVMFRYAELVGQHLEEFALLDTLDMGKPINEMLTIDGPASKMTFQFFAESIDKMEGAVTQTASDAFHYIVREPLGVVGCVVPWNYPLMMAAWKIAPALAAGNSVVLKPAEQSPMSAALLAKLFMDAGGPAGVLNVVNGYGEEVGKALALHMDVDKIAFTGSVEVGKLMMIYAGQSNMKRVSNECGGKTPQIIMADTPDLDVAVAYAVNGIYGNQGEVCNAGSRLLVHAKIQDEFVAKFIERSKTAFTPGDPLDGTTTMGPLVTAAQQKRVLGYIDAGKEEGAVLAFGGGVPASQANGFYVEPTMFSGVKPGMKIAQEEIFGPVASVMAFKSTEEALEIANGTIYGLAASIWTRDITVAHKMARAVEAGVIWINCFDHGDMTQPWGGYKQTGSGRDKCFAALLAHTQSKSVWVNLPN